MKFWGCFNVRKVLVCRSHIVLQRNPLRLPLSRDLTEVINRASAHKDFLFSSVASVKNRRPVCCEKFSAMPESAHPYINGYQNGHMESENVDEGTFLFTSESVGEGHPGNFNYYNNINLTRSL